MKVNCPGCKRAYKVDDSRVQGQGLAMRCPQCGNSFIVSAGGIVRDASSGSVPSEPRREISSVHPRRPSKGPSGLGEGGSGSFDLRDGVLNVEPSSVERLDSTKRQEVPAKPVVVRDSWGFEMAPYDDPRAGPPTKKTDPFADLGLTATQHEPTLEIGDLGGDDDAIDLPAPVDMADRSSRNLPPPPKANKPVAAPAITDDPFGEIDLGATLKSRRQEPSAPSKVVPSVTVSSTPPAPRLSDSEADFGDIRLSGFDVKPPTPHVATGLGSIGPSPERLSVDLVGGSAGGLPPLGSSLERDSAAKEISAKQEIQLASVPPVGGSGYGEFDFGSTQASASADEFDLGGAQPRSPLSAGVASPPLPSFRPSPGDSAHEFDGIPTHRGNGPPSRERTDGSSRERLELAVDPRERVSESGHIVDDGVPRTGGGKPAKTFSGWRRLERQSRKFKIGLLAGLLAIIAGGVGLNWTPLGLFGTTAIAKLLPSSTADKVLQDKTRLVADVLAKDEYRSCQSAREEVTAALNELPDEESLRLLGVFLAYYMEVRFGEDKMLSSAAAKLLGGINLEESESIWAPLARGARDVRAGGGEAGYLASVDPSLKAHALALQVLSALKARQPDKASTLVDKLSSVEAKTPRVAFLKAQALALNGQTKDAIAVLEKLLLAAPKHTDAGALLARELLEVRPVPVERVEQVVADMVPRARPLVAASGHATLAKLHYMFRHFTQAKDEAEKALTLYPNEPLALVVKGDLSLHDGDTVLAATMYNKALAEVPEYLPASLGLTEVKLHEGRLSEAKEKAQLLVNAHKDSARAHYVMGLALEATDSGEAARAEFSKAIELDSDELDAYLGLARSHMKAKQDAEAMAVLDKAAAALPGNPLIARTLASAHGARGDYPAAIVELNKALEMSPDDPETYFMMAQMYRKMKAFSDARSALAEVEKRAPAYAGLGLEKGLIAEQEGNLVAALAEYEKALAAAPDNPNAKIRIGAVAHDLGEEAKAEKFLAEAVAALPGSAEANFLLGEVYRVTKRPSEAMRLLQVARELDRTNGLYALRYGMSLMDLGDKIGAMRAFEEAQGLSPENGEIYLRIGEVELAQGSARDCIASVEKALRLQPNLPEAHGVLGRAYEELSDFKTARAHYRLAVQALPKDAEVNFLLGLSELKVSGERASLPPLQQAVKVVEETGERPEWLPEALFRLGMAQAAVGQRSAAIASLRRYFEVAPENHLDMAEVQANLERLTAN